MGLGDIWHMFLIVVPYFGEVGIAAWEWLLGVVYLMVLFIVFGRMKNMRIGREPEYRHFLWGLYAKVIGGVAFSLIYFYYYGGGDTIAYFFSARSMTHLATSDPLAFLKVLFGPNDPQHLSLFSGLSVKPLNYVYYDDRTFMVVRFVSPLVLLSFRSYLITTLLFSSICYIGMWRCYQMMVGYFPSLTDRLAIAFLYVPSVIFWGSGIMKDTITLSAACWWVYCFDKVFFKKDSVVWNAVGLALAGFFIIMQKPYVLLALLPMTVLWLLYFRVVQIRNALIRLAVLPLALLIMAAGSYAALVRLGDEMGKFSLDQVLETTVLLQNDLKRADEYGHNYFDIGAFDGTVAGGVKLAPRAINAALFRPYLWESSNVVMAVSGLENALMLLLTIWVILRAGPRFILRSITGNPLVMMCILYSLLFAFMVGFTTPNFGALVRFKIPMIPFYLSGLFIILFLKEKERYMRNRGKRFNFALYRRGEPRPAPRTARSPSGAVGPMTGRTGP